MYVFRVYVTYACSVTKPGLTLWDPMDCMPTRLLCLWDSPGKDTGVGSLSFLQGIFLIQRLNPCLLCLLYWQEDSLPLCYLESPLYYHSLYTILEKEMATHSSVLAWRISWTEEPGGLQSMGSQRVGHDWATNTTYAILIFDAWFWVAKSWTQLSDWTELCN